MGVQASVREDCSQPVGGDQARELPTAEILSSATLFFGGVHAEVSAEAGLALKGGTLQASDD